MSSARYRLLTRAAQNRAPVCGALSQHSGRTARRNSQRGSAMLESALSILPLLALLFCVLDLSIAIFVKNTMQFAVRQGVRYAVTGQTMSGMGQDNSIKTVVKQNSIGFLDFLSPNKDGMSRVSINYYNPQTLALVTGVNSNRGGNIVVVSATGLSWAWMVPLLRSATPMQFSVSSADIMEASPSAGVPAR